MRRTLLLILMKSNKMWIELYMRSAAFNLIQRADIDLQSGLEFFYKLFWRVMHHMTVLQPAAQRGVDNFSRITTETNPINFMLSGPLAL